MNKHDFDKYSKEEIVNILIKYQVDYNSQGILNDLYRCRKYNEEKLIEKNKGVIGLDLALLKCFCETIKSLTKRKLYICSSTIDVYNKLQESVGELLDED